MKHTVQLLACSKASQYLHWKCIPYLAMPQFVTKLSTYLPKVGYDFRGRPDVVLDHCQNVS